MLRVILGILLLCSVASAQTITWTKAYTSSGGGTFNAYYNGYHDIHYDPLTDRTWIYSTSTAGGAESIYSTRLQYFNSHDSSLTTLLDDQQAAVGACNGNRSTWPGTRHPVGEFFLDTGRSRLWLMEGVCNTDIWADTYQYQLTSPIGGTSWNLSTPNHVPIANTQNGNRITTLSAAVTSSGQTTITVTDGSHLSNGYYLKVSTEQMLIVSGGLTNSLTVARGQLGTSALSSISNGTAATMQVGVLNNAVINFDNTHDAFIVNGTNISNLGRQYVYCDTNGTGTLTAGQTSVGCTNADDYTELTSTVTGTGGFPPGDYYPNTEWDSVNGREIQFGGLSGCCTVMNQVWVYAPTTKTWTAKQALPGSYTAVTIGGSDPVVFDFSVAASLSLSLTRNVTSASFTGGVNGSTYHVKLCQDSTGGRTWGGWPANASVSNGYVPSGASASGTANCMIASFLFDGTTYNAISPFNASANNEGGRVAHAYANGKYYYHLTGKTPATSGTVAIQPQDWVYDGAANTWTLIQTNQGPYLTETMTYDSTCNCLIAWAANVSGTTYLGTNSEIWVGQMSNGVQSSVSGLATISGKVSVQ